MLKSGREKEKETMIMRNEKKRSGLRINNRTNQIIGYSLLGKRGNKLFKLKL